MRPLKVVAFKEWPQLATDTSVSSSVRCHAAEDSANHYPQQGISGVVRSRYIVHAILRDQFLESSLRLSLFKQQRVEHRDSLNPKAGAMSFCEKWILKNGGKTSP